MGNIFEICGCIRFRYRTHSKERPAETTEKGTLIDNATTMETGTLTDKREKETLSDNATTREKETLLDKAATRKKETLTVNATTREKETLADNAATREKETPTDNAATREKETLTINATRGKETLADNAATREKETLTDNAATREKETFAENTATSEKETLTGNAATREKETLAENTATSEKETLTDNARTTENETHTDMELFNDEQLGEKTVYLSKKEEGKCSITGLCVLSEKYLVAVDNRNKQVKVVDKHTIQTVDYVAMKESPFDVARINDECFAVTVPTTEYIHIFSVSAKGRFTMSTKNDKIFAGGDCHGIEYNSKTEMFVILRLGMVKQVSMKTDVKSKFQRMKSVSSLSAHSQDQMPDHIALSQDKKVIYVNSRYHNKVKALHAKVLTVVTTLTDEDIPDLKRPEGLTVDKNDFVYVCVFESHQIMKFSGQLVEQQPLSTWSVIKPQSIAYCKYENKLYVGTTGNSTIKSLNL